MKFIIKESKLKHLFKKKLGVDLEGKVKLVTNYEDVPTIFKKYISRDLLNHYLNRYGPMYYVIGKTGRYLCQPQSNTNTLIVDENDMVVSKDKFNEDIGLEHDVIPFADLMNIYLEE